MYMWHTETEAHTHTHVTTLPGREPFVSKLVYVHALCSRLPDVVVAPGRACLTLRMSYKKFLFLYVVYACLAKTHPRTHSHTHMYMRVLAVCLNLNGHEVKPVLDSGPKPGPHVVFRDGREKREKATKK